MTVIHVEKKVLNENQRIALELRRRFEENNVLCLNFISSPGSGKTRPIPGGLSCSSGPP